MSRRDDYLDAMLKHLGATYYRTLEGDATASDVADAVASVQEEVARHPGQFPAPGRGDHGRHAGRWRVRDAMRTQAVTVRKRTPVKEIARLMSEHRVSAVPVLDEQDLVVGVVSEADLIRPRERRRAALSRVPGRISKARGATAAHLMTSPAITIHPDEPLTAAARRMDQNRLRLLPVVDTDGHLLGVISRRNLLSIFLRTDEEIAGEVRALLRNVLLLPRGSVTVSVRDGVVTLSGQVDGEGTRRAAVQLVGDVYAVMEVIDKLSAPPARRALHRVTP